MAAPTVLDQAEAEAPPRETSLLRWVWRTYVRNALIPLLVVELLLVAVYITSHAWSLRRNVAALTEVARQELARIAESRLSVGDASEMETNAMRIDAARAEEDRARFAYEALVADPDVDALFSTDSNGSSLSVGKPEDALLIAQRARAGVYPTVTHRPELRRPVVMPVG